MSKLCFLVHNIVAVIATEIAYTPVHTTVMLPVHAHADIMTYSRKEGITEIQGDATLTGIKTPLSLSETV